MAKNNPQLEPYNLEVTYEARDLRVNTILLIGLALLGTILLTLLISYVTYHHFLRETNYEHSLKILSPLREGQAAPLPPEPRLQGAPGHPMLGPEELQTVLGAANQQLNSYGWVNQQAGIAHIPVEEAMRIIAEKGLPNVPATPAAAGKAAGGSTPAKAAGGAAKP